MLISMFEEFPELAIHQFCQTLNEALTSAHDKLNEVGLIMVDLASLISISSPPPLQTALPWVVVLAHLVDLKEKQIFTHAHTNVAQIMLEATHQLSTQLQAGHLLIDEGHFQAVLKVLLSCFYNLILFKLLFSPSALHQHATPIARQATFR